MVTDQILTDKTQLSVAAQIRLVFFNFLLILQRCKEKKSVDKTTKQGSLIRNIVYSF